MEDVAETDQVVVLHEGDLVFSGTPYQTFTHFSEAEFQKLGLGIPHALAWAQRLSRATGINLGEPLTLSDLVDALLDVVMTTSGAAQVSDLTQGGRCGA